MRDARSGKVRAAQWESEVEAVFAKGLMSAFGQKRTLAQRLKTPKEGRSIRLFGIKPNVCFSP